MYDSTSHIAPGTFQYHVRRSRRLLDDRTSSTPASFRRAPGQQAAEAAADDDDLDLVGKGSLVNPRSTYVLDVVREPSGDLDVLLVRVGTTVCPAPRGTWRAGRRGRSRLGLRSSTLHDPKMPLLCATCRQGFARPLRVADRRYLGGETEDPRRPARPVAPNTYSSCSCVASATQPHAYRTPHGSPPPRRPTTREFPTRNISSRVLVHVVVLGELDAAGELGRRASRP